jgi:hypothetical protein
MKTKMILAFKKKLSEVNNYDDIDVECSLHTYYGGYSYYKFDKFELNQMVWSKSLKYNNTQVELEHDEWLELKSMVEEKRSSLNTDYDEIMNIIKS